MRVLLATWGSHGDVLPVLALAREFQRRGHEALFFGNPYFGPLFARAGLGFVPVGTEEQYRAFFANVGQAKGNATRARAAVAEALAGLTATYHAAMRQHVVPGATIAVDSSMVFAARLLQETDGVPCATAHIAPTVFRSSLAPARLDPNKDWLRLHAPRCVQDLGWWLKDRLYNQRYYNGPFNRLRAGLGLPPVDHLFKNWVHSRGAVVALFPAWFAPPPADWPPHLKLAGFPLCDLGEETPLSAELVRFLEAGPPPVVLSAGTANGRSQAFFATSVAACRAAGLRAVLLAHFDGQVPAQLPPGMLHVAYAPFGALLPRAAAFVHHGGIGATSQALRAAVPQLIRPTAYDQFDNSERAVKLGVACELLPADYTEAAVARTLRRLVDEPGWRERARAVQANFARPEAARDGAVAACDAILAGCTGAPAG